MPDNPSGTVLSQLETFQAAVPYLEEALSVAQSAGATDLANLARTGLARAHIGLGNWAKKRPPTGGRWIPASSGGSTTWT